MPLCFANAARSRLTLVRQSTTVPKTSNRQARMSIDLLLELRVRELSEVSLVIAQIEQERDLVLRKLAHRHSVLQFLQQVEHLADALDAAVLDEGPDLAAGHEDVIYSGAARGRRRSGS